ncbi:glycosyl transferase, partial [archaeon]|nr:glycosyl transferase [archaeon]
MKLSIIIPVYNEVKTLEEVINKVKKLKLDKEIVVVDDGSEDGSRELLKKIENIKLILHEKNYGKGKAVRTGLDNIEGDVVVIQDADLEYDPTDFVKMFDEIKNGEKVVYGSRFLEKFDKVI